MVQFTVDFSVSFALLLYLYGRCALLDKDVILNMAVKYFINVLAVISIKLFFTISVRHISLLNKVHFISVIPISTVYLTVINDV